MNNVFYAKLAANNIKKNSKTYIPYIISCILTVAMYYIITALSMNESLNSMMGSETVEYTLTLGSKVIAVFSFVFLFYTNSFLIKRRKKEFGLLNILGMEKRHISRILAFETVYMILISLAGGFFAGAILDKLMFLSLARILGSNTLPEFYISFYAMAKALILFGVIFFCIFINSVRQIHLAKPAELLKGSDTGEKEPKTKWILAVLGVLCLGTGYYFAVSTKNPVSAVTLFFVAVILVIAGTYLLFTSGSIALLKILRKNKRYYYKINHFTAVSGMLYRMKQNAVGLANICILSTMVLVMISSTTSLIIGVEDVINTRYPYDITVYYGRESDKDRKEFSEYIEKTAEEKNINMKNKVSYDYLSFSAVRDENSFFIPESMDMSYYNQFSVLMIVTEDDFADICGEKVTLDDDEIILCTDENMTNYKSLDLFGKNYNIKQTFSYSSEFTFRNGLISANVAQPCQIVVKDMTAIKQFDRIQKDIYRENASEISLFFGCDTDDKDAAAAFCKDISEAAKEISKSEDKYSIIIDNREEGRDSALSLFGGLFFLGVFLGITFIIAAVLIIYYKQISEGYEDRQRFIIMQNVGMSREEVKKTIHSQVLTVFFLPLIMAGMHIIFAFPMIKSILAAMTLTNTKLYIICTCGCFLLFTIFYMIVYLLTSKIYYKIIKK